MTLEVRAPLAGTVVSLGTVADPVFSQAVLGAGTALDPLRHNPGSSQRDRVTATAPVDGRITKIHPHAFVVTTRDGRELLVHLGLDTVGRTSPRFTTHAAQGQAVVAGDPVITWSPAVVERLRLSPVVPVIALRSTGADLQRLRPAGEQVQAGDVLFSWADSPGHSH